MNEEQEKEILNEAKIQTARHKKKIQIISLVAIIAVIAMATVACIPLIKALHSKAGILRYAPWHNGNIRACEKIWQTDSGSLC